MRSLGGQILRFGGVGLIGTCSHYLILLALVEGLAVAPVVASSAGAVTGALINYILNRRYTFTSRRAHREALPRFMAVALAGLTLNAAILAVLLSWGVHYMPGQLMATALVLLLSFAVNRSWTFEPKS